jgi:hypothetical protein
MRNQRHGGEIMRVAASGGGKMHRHISGVVAAGKSRQANMARGVSNGEAAAAWRLSAAERRALRRPSISASAIEAAKRLA